MKEMEKILLSFENGDMFTAFDTETTGLKPSSERIIELGAVRFNKNGVQARYNALINPQKPIPPVTIAIHGIKDTMVCDKPLFKDIANDFLSFISGTRLIAHNCGFDVGFLNTELKNAKLPILKAPNFPAIDSIKCCYKTFPGLGKYNLQFLAKTLHIDTEHAHRAQDDAEVCMKIFIKCMETFKSEYSRNN